MRSIAAELRRAPSTVSRELRRNGGHGRYRAAAADSQAWDRALRPKLCKLARHEELRQLVAARRQDNWSPEQIAGWLRHTYPDEEAHQVSHETIYRSLSTALISLAQRLPNELLKSLTWDRGKDPHCC